MKSVDRYFNWTNKLISKVETYPTLGWLGFAIIDILLSYIIVDSSNAPFLVLVLMVIPVLMILVGLLLHAAIILSLVIFDGLFEELQKLFQTGKKVEVVEDQTKQLGGNMNIVGNVGGTINPQHIGPKNPFYHPPLVHYIELTKEQDKYLSILQSTLDNYKNVSQLSEIEKTMVNIYLEKIQGIRDEGQYLNSDQVWLNESAKLYKNLLNGD